MSEEIIMSPGEPESPPPAPQQTEQNSMTDTTTNLTPPKSKKKRLIVLVVIVAIFGLGAVLVHSKLRPEKVNPYAVVKLSNGKEIFLGQSVSALKAVMGNDLRNPKPDYYEYPSQVGIGHTLQATIWVNKDKLVAIRISFNSDNQQKSTGVHIGMSLNETKTKTNNAVQPILEFGKYGVARGLTLKNKDVTSYYLVNPCAPPSEEVVVFAITSKGFDDKVKELGAGCTARGH